MKRYKIFIIMFEDYNTGEKTCRCAFNTHSAAINYLDSNLSDQDYLSIVETQFNESD